MKPDGRLVQLEYRKEDPNVPILPDHKMSVAEAKTEVEAEGFKLGPVIETLPRQHILIYTKAGRKAPPRNDARTILHVLAPACVNTFVGLAPEQCLPAKQLALNNLRHGRVDA